MLQVQESSPAVEEPSVEGRVLSASEPLVSATLDRGVVINLRLSDQRLGSAAERCRLAILEEQIEAIFSRRGDMWFDGRDIGEGYCALYCSGPDAGAIVAALQPLLKAFGPAAGSYISFTDSRYLASGALKRIDLSGLDSTRSEP